MCKLEGRAGSTKQSKYLKSTQMLLGPALCSGQELLRFMAVKVFKCFQFFNKCLVLVLQDGHSVLQTLDILLFLPATFTGCLSVGRITHSLSLLFILWALLWMLYHFYCHHTVWFLWNASSPDWLLWLACYDMLIGKFLMQEQSHYWYQTYKDTDSPSFHTCSSWGGLPVCGWPPR